MKSICSSVGRVSGADIQNPADPNLFTFGALLSFPIVSFNVLIHFYGTSLPLSLRGGLTSEEFRLMHTVAAESTNRVDS